MFKLQAVKPRLTSGPGRYPGSVPMPSELSYIWSQYNKIGTSSKHYINIIGYSEQQNINDIILQTINFQEYFILVIFDSVEEIIRKFLTTKRIEHPLSKCIDT